MPSQESQAGLTVIFSGLIATVPLASNPAAHSRLVMNCSFSGRPVPADKLFLLYYPPAAAHEPWDKSFFAAARAREALAEAAKCLEAFFWRYVATRGVLSGLGLFLAGAASLAAWAYFAVTGWGDLGFFARYAPPAAGLVVTLVGRARLRAFLARWRLWREGGRATVAKELEAIGRVTADMPSDPDAEEAAAIMRRQFPDTMSDIVFWGRNFRAFTYMDFVLTPKMRHPADLRELPTEHSLYRDAYYVGEVVYDNPRMFQRDRRTVADPRFIGSGGRRGVI